MKPGGPMKGSNKRGSMGRTRRLRFTLRSLLAASAFLGFAMPASAQFTGLAHGPGGSGKQEPVTGNDPVTFQADSVSYDKEHGLVSAEGHVEAWQNDHILRADRVTFDRNTNVAAAYGHVVIAEPDGEVIFADYAELTQGMKNGVLTGMRAQLAENGKLASNGARRTEGKLNELSRGVYTTCNVCALDPDANPLWELRANHVVQDLEHKRIEYFDAYLDFYGFPVFYFPYFSNADPSVRRQSGLLVPSIGITDKHLGTFASVPYFLVLDDQSDLTITATGATKGGLQLENEYRRDFNNGVLRVTGSIAYLKKEAPVVGDLDPPSGLQGYVFAHGAFTYNDTWRYGFDINIASSIDYMRDFRIPGYGANVLGSSIYVEGFGVGSYSRLDGRAYQGLNSSIKQSLLPYVLPRYEYSFFSEPDGWGGRWSFDTQDFNVLREEGTNDQRAAAKVSWDRPFAGYLGDRWMLSLQGTGAAYNANVLNGQPNYAQTTSGDSVHGQVQAVVKLNWPFVRDAGTLGNQVIEPIAQLIAAPNAGNSVRDNIPNEDSLDYEFTDSTLFQTNRFGGYDRFDGGTRANYALHLAWNFPGGQKIDGLVGQSWQEHIDHNLYPEFQPWNGFDLGSHVSDVVSRISFVPDNWIDFTARGRFDHSNGDVRFADGVTSFGKPILHASLGYFYGSTNPYALYLANYNIPANFKYTPTNIYNPFNSFFTPRQEAEISLSSHFLSHYTINAHARRDVQTGRLVEVGGDAKYEDECFIFDLLAVRRYTSINFDQGDSTVLFTITLKTVGQFGFNG